MTTINDHIKYNEEEISDPLISPQRKRHLQTELEDLTQYKQNHPNEEKDPTSLELYCDLNPDAPECRVYNV